MTLGVLLTVPGLVTVAAVAWQLVSAVPLSFHTDGMYTYDYDQYDHVARALLDGHAWLDLDVPDALRDADNPYDVTTRQQHQQRHTQRTHRKRHTHIRANRIKRNQ